MMKTCLNSRDGLIVLEMDKLAYIQADGNYANLVYMCGDSVLVTLGLSKLEEVIRRAWPCEKVSPFVRMGRSLIINQTYLSEVRINTQKLVLSDNVGHKYTLSVPKPVLKTYRENIYDLYVRNQQM